MSSGTSSAPARIYNIGNHQPVELLHFIEVLENALGKKAVKKLKDNSEKSTLGDIEALSQLKTDLAEKEKSDKKEE